MAIYGGIAVQHLSLFSAVHGFSLPFFSVTFLYFLEQCSSSKVAAHCREQKKGYFPLRRAAPEITAQRLQTQNKSD